MKNRKAFNFYRSYYDLVVELPDEQKVQFLMAILNKQFLDIEPQLDGLVGLLYKSQKHSIDAQVNGYKNKKGMSLTTNTPSVPPYVPPTEGPTQPPSVQEKEKGEEKEKEQVQEQVYVKNKYRYIKYDKLKDEYQFEYKTKKQKEQLDYSQLLEYENEENVYIKNYQK
jgi:hypothetical protein